MDFCALCFDLQKQSILNFITREKACFARILTYCATHALPYPCTPTGVSCLSSELFLQSASVSKRVFRHAEVGGNSCRRLETHNTFIIQKFRPNGNTFCALRLVFVVMHNSSVQISVTFPIARCRNICYTLGVRRKEKTVYEKFPRPSEFGEDGIDGKLQSPNGSRHKRHSHRTAVFHIEGGR